MPSAARSEGTGRAAAAAWLAVVVAVAWASSASAQQTIINVPSDVVTPRGRHFVLHESAIVPSGGDALFQTTNFYTYGLTRRTELAATLYNVDGGGSPDAALGLGFKSVHPLLDERAPDFHLKATIGHMTPISLRPSAQAVGFFTYGHLSFDVPGTDLRLLGGAAGGSRNLFGRDAASVLAGVEYPIGDHLSFTGEWFSGQHNLSGLIPGLTYHRDDLIVVAGYKFPNDFNPRGQGLVLEAGWFFGRKSMGDQEDKDNKDEIHYGERPPRRGGVLGRILGGRR